MSLYNFYLIPLYLLISACGKVTNDASDINKKLKTIEGNQFEDKSDLSLSKVITLNEKNKQIDIPKADDNVRKFIKSFCSSLENSQIDNTNISIFSDKAFVTWNQYKSFFESNSYICNSTDIEQFEYPNYMIEFKDPKTSFTIVTSIRVNQDSKIELFHTMAMPEEISFKKKMLKVDSDVKLGTYIIKLKNKIAPVMLLKTPYLSLGFQSVMAQALPYLSQGFHVIAQSNRGSFESTGNFKWLHKENINDQKVTLDWISKQSFYRSGIIAYGVSYAGFNSLTASATNHKELKAVIACSAPANSKTDSFTANEIIEFGQLSYISMVKEGYSLNLSNDITQAIKSNIELSELDTVILGRDEVEWNELVESTKNNSTYHADRNILPQVMNTKIPTLISGGFHEDQDGRDSIISFETLSKNEKISGYFHQFGHGCGKLENEIFYKTLLSQINTNAELDTFTKLTITSSKEKYESSLPDFPMKKVSFTTDYVETLNNPNESIGLTFVEDPLFGSEKPKRTTFIRTTPLDTDVEVFGRVHVKLKVKSYSPFNSLNIALFFVHNNSPQILSRNYTHSQYSRAQHLIKVPFKDVNIEIEMNPTVVNIPKGSVFILDVSSHNPFSVPLYNKERIEFKQNTNLKMGAAILEQPELIFDTIYEKSEAL